MSLVSKDTKVIKIVASEIKQYPFGKPLDGYLLFKIITSCEK